MLYCVVCNTPLKITQLKYQWDDYCDKCRIKYHRKHNGLIAKLSSKKNKYNTLKRKFKLNDIQINEIKNTYHCQICNCELTHHKSKKTKCIDHCHKTNTYRGILCMKCNWHISYYEDLTQDEIIDRLNKILAYIDKI